MVELLTLIEPVFWIPPPSAKAELPDTVELLRLIVPLLTMPPPRVAVLLAMVSLVSVIWPELRMPAALYPSYPALLLTVELLMVSEPLL